MMDVKFQEHIKIKPSIGWWGADSDCITGQAIVTRHVVGLLGQGGVSTFSYQGKKMRLVISSFWSSIRLVWAVLNGKIKALYLVCSRSSVGFMRDIPAYVAQFFGVRVLVHVHGSDVVDLCRRPVIGWLAKILLSRCEVIVPSSHLIEPLRGEGVSRLHICENFVHSTDAFKISISENGKRQELCSFKVLWNSNLMASKGFFAVVQAVGELVDQGRDIQLIALGEPLGDEVMNLTECRYAVSQIKRQKWIEFKGSLDREATLSLLSEADMVCLPSQYSSECQPLALVEAMCFGKMILISNTAALRVTVGDYPCSIIEGQKPYEIRIAIQKFMDKPTDQEILLHAAERARKRFSQARFDFEISSLLGVISQVEQSDGGLEQIK